MIPSPTLEPMSMGSDRTILTGDVLTPSSIRSQLMSSTVSTANPKQPYKYLSHITQASFHVPERALD